MPIWSLTSFPGFSARPYKKVLGDTQQFSCPWERGCVELGEVWGDLPFFWRFKSAFSLFVWTRSGLSTPNCHCANYLRYIHLVRKKTRGVETRTHSH